MVALLWFSCCGSITAARKPRSGLVRHQHCAKKKKCSLHMMLGMLCTTGLLKKTSCKCMPALSLLTGDQGGRKRTHETCGRWPWKFAKAQNQRSSTIARTSGNRPNSTRLYDDLIKACGPECLSKQMKTLDHTYKHVETSHEHHPEEPVLHCEPKQQYQAHHRLSHEYMFVRTFESGHITRIHVCHN